MANQPTSTIAALAWLKSVLTAEVTVVRALPAEADVTVPQRTGGFVVPRVVGGGGGADEAPIREPVLGVQCWMPPPTVSSSIVQLNAAELLGNRVWNAARQDPPTGYILDPAAAGLGNYRRVWVRTVVPLGEPREIPNDPSNYARFDLDMQFHWTEI